jgi:hypothetical protein
MVIKKWFSFCFNIMSRTRSILFLVLVLSACLNCFALNWGLPGNWYNDSKVKLFLQMTHRGSLNPKFFYHPSFHLYVTGLTLVPYAFYKYALFKIPLDDRTNYEIMLLIGRALSAMLAVLTVAATYFLGKQVYGRNVGIWAAFFLATTMSAIEMAHMDGPEAMLAFLCVMTLICLIRFIVIGGTREAIFAGAVMGFAIATKQSAMVLPVVAVIASFVRLRDEVRFNVPSRSRARRAAFNQVALIAGFLLTALLLPRMAFPPDLYTSEQARAIQIFFTDVTRLCYIASILLLGLFFLPMWAKRSKDALTIFLTDRRIVILFLMMLLCYFVGTPFTLLDFKTFLQDFSQEWVERHSFKGFSNAGRSWLPYVSIIGNGMGWPSAILCFTGLALTILKCTEKRAETGLILLFTALFYGILGSFRWRSMYYLAPLWPILSLYAGNAAWFLTQMPTTSLAIGSRIIVGFVAAYSVAYACALDCMLRCDTRNIIQNWMAVNVPLNSKVDTFAHECYLPNFRSDLVVRNFVEVDDMDFGAAKFEEFALRYPHVGGDYVVLTSLYYNRYFDEFDAPHPFPERTRFYRSLMQGHVGYEVVAKAEVVLPFWLRPRPDNVSPNILVLQKRNDSTSD